MSALEKAFKMADRTLLLAFGISFLFHASLLVVVLSVEMPEPVSKEEYVDWVQKLVQPRREATVIQPERATAYTPEKTAETGAKAGPKNAVAQGGPAKAAEAAMRDEKVSANPSAAPAY